MGLIYSRKREIRRRAIIIDYCMQDTVSGHDLSPVIVNSIYRFKLNDNFRLNTFLFFLNIAFPEDHSSGNNVIELTGSGRIAGTP
jgi:hypothetical protein